MVHRSSRLVDICFLMRQYRIEPKRIRFIHPRIGEEAMMVLIEGVKDGKPEIRTQPPSSFITSRMSIVMNLWQSITGKEQHWNEGI